MCLWPVGERPVPSRPWGGRRHGARAAVRRCRATPSTARRAAPPAARCGSSRSAARRTTSSAEVALGAPRRRWLAPSSSPPSSRSSSSWPSSAAAATSRPPPRPPRSTVPHHRAADHDDHRGDAPPRPPPRTRTFAAAPLPGGRRRGRLQSTNDGDVLRIDLGTGAVQRRPRADRAPAWPARGWCSAARAGSPWPTAPTTTSPPSTACSTAPTAPRSDRQLVSRPRTTGRCAPRSTAAAEPDEVWVWNDAVDDEATTIKRVRLDGTVTAGPGDAPPLRARCSATTGPAPWPLQGPSGFYRATIDGHDGAASSGCGPATPVAYSSGALLDLDCDDGLQCHLAVVDRATGAARAVPGDVIDRVVPDLRQHAVGRRALARQRQLRRRRRSPS